jgi:hypothetical protein
VIIIVIVLVIVGYIVIQGTRAARAWRKAASAGDVDVIKRIVGEAIDSWRSVRRPKEVPPDVWRGIQSMDLVEVGPDSVRVSCQAESEYRLLDDRWVETSNPLQEGMAITARAADMIFYELPYFRPQLVQIDVYTTFRGPDGSAKRQCILSTPATRELARQVGWDEWSATEIVDALGGLYQLGESDQPLPIAPRQSAIPGGNGRGPPLSP